MHHRAIAKAESVFKIMKSLLVKTNKEGGDPYEVMLEQRNTPRQDTGCSPAEMMFNRRTRSFLPGMSNSPMDPLVKEKREAPKRSVKKAHNRKSQRLSKIDVGQSVFFQHPEGQKWKLDKPTDVLGPNTYEISGSNGGMYRRNHVHMRPTSIALKPRDLFPVLQPRVLDVAPLTLPEEAPKESNLPKDPLGGHSQPCKREQKHHTY